LFSGSRGILDIDEFLIESEPSGEVAAESLGRQNAPLQQPVNPAGRSNV